MSDLRLLFFLKLFLLLPVVLLSTPPGGKPFIINFPKDEFKAGNQNWSVAVDNHGIAYFGNNKGLLQFDGANWSLNKMPQEDVVRSVCVGNQNRIYVGAYEEFGFFKRDEKSRLSYVSLSDSLDQDVFHNDEIWRIITFHDKVYFQSFNSLFVYDDQSVKMIFSGMPVVLLLKVRNRLFIHRVGNGLYELKDEQLHLARGSKVLSGDEVKFMLPYKENKFLVGAAQKGLYIYDGKSFTPWNIKSAPEIRSAEINCGLYSNKQYVIGTIVNGIFVLNNKGQLLYHLNTDNNLQNNTVLSLNNDAHGNIWAGLDRGIDYIDLHAPLDFYIDKSGIIGSVYAAAFYKNNLWIGTNRGLYKYRKHLNKSFTDPIFIKGTQGQVWDLQVFDDQLICGHNSGTYRVSLKGNLTKLSDVNGGFCIKKVNFNDSAYLLQSTYSSFVVYKKKDQKWEFSHAIDGFIEPIPHFEIDHKNQIWASHLNQGVFLLRLNNTSDSISGMRRFSKSKGLTNDRKIDVSLIDGRVVFANREKLYTYDDLNDTIIPYDKLNHSLGEFKDAQKIACSRDDKYWFIDQNKIALFRIINHKLNRQFNYHLERQGLYMSSEYPTIINLSTQNDLICLDNGFALYQERDSIPKYEEKVMLRKAIVKNNRGGLKHLSLNAQKQFEIPYNCRNLHFIYSSTEISVNPVFRHKLKGLGSNAFSEWSSKSSTEYSRLPAGEYVFIVQTKNLSGKISNTATFSFRILPPWYASTVAWIVYGVLFISLLIYMRFLFLQRLQKHEAQLEQRKKEEREKERMLERQKYMDLQNEKLHSELDHKNVQLANYTMSLVHKNDVLTNIKAEIKKQKTELGPRFPNYYYRNMIRLIDRNISSEHEWKTFEGYFDQIHQGFFKRLMDEYPELTQSDLQLCAFLRMNLSTKEIAPLLNISIRGVEARRYRLRKRMGLEHDANLVEHLLQF
ncbi:MAG: hypothetical protein K9I94_15125 [Bacteroidales bacterium]|nr:hypothetical protein [Bacteroidales bacterium]